MCIFTYGLSSSRSTFFFAIFLLFPRGRDFRFSSLLLAFFPLDGFGSSTQQKGFVVARQQNRIGRLSLSPFSFSLLDEQRRVVGKSSESRQIRRDISKYNGRRTKNDGQRSQARRATTTARPRQFGEGNNTTFIKASSSFLYRDDKTTKQNE